MPANALQTYLQETPRDSIDAGLTATIASLTTVAASQPALARSIVQELADQRSHLKLIASENYCSLPTQLAMGNLLTDKYAEGISGGRFYAGCDNVDAIEDFASTEACKLFGVDHAYVQPHSGADANLVAFWAILSARVMTPALVELGEMNPSHLDAQVWEKIRQACGNQRLLGLDYYSGGHLTHGYRLNVSAQMFEAHSYEVDRETGLLDYDAIERQAIEVKPLILLAGYSAYPRKINFQRMRQIADRVGAVLMVDMAHFAGLVAGCVFLDEFNPVAHAHVVTTTTHKTLRGPRGGAVFCTAEFAEHVNKGCPLILGGPLPHVMAAKGVALAEANQSAFQDYAQSVVSNAHALAEACLAEGLTLATGGTDNHLLLIDVRPFGLTGRQAESAVRACGITLNRNSLPFDPNGPWYTSGLRIGTPAVTTLGMKADEMKEIAAVLAMVLKNTHPTKLKKGGDSRSKFVTDAGIIESATERVRALLSRFPVYPQLDLEFLQRHFS